MRWSVQDARDLYNIAQWSEDLFDIDREGNLVAFPNGRDKSPVVLPKLIEHIQAQGLSLPVLIRFPDILRERFRRMNEVFSRAIVEHRYEGKYTAVYPIKVNQQRSVVEEIFHPNPQSRIGLESGSKAELMAILGVKADISDLIICNGYKDREYIRLALIGQILGNEVYIILEKLSELKIVLEESRKMGVQPKLGIRIRLASVGKGKWQATGGAKSKFGFSAQQVLDCVACLKAENMLSALQVIHFHLGSQVANIRDIYHGMQECARYYAELRQLDVPIRLVDVGGGLAVDYDGTHSRSDCSMNYSLQEYANNIVYALQSVCQEYDIPHPDIMTESGRAMTAHHAVLITNVVDTEIIEKPRRLSPPQASDAQILQDLWQGYLEVSNRSVLEAYHDASYWMTEVYSRYSHGILSLSERARAEQIFYATCFKVREYLNPKIRAHREVVDELNEKLADKYFCNFSLFQSMPDAWAIDQVFPILPLSQLNLAPDRRVVLQDMTCDSDGKVDWYVDGQGLETTLPIVAFDPQKPYLLGVFLVGAYQEILGDMHNLFGDTNSINVETDETGAYRLAKAEEGDTVSDVLRYVHFSEQDLLTSYRDQLSQVETLSAEQQSEIFEELSAGLQGYTYLEE